jgi:hypothetical protein
MFNAQSEMWRENTASLDELGYVFAHAKYWASELLRHDYSSVPAHDIFWDEWSDGVIEAFRPQHIETQQQPPQPPSHLKIIMGQSANAPTLIPSASPTQTNSQHPENTSAFKDQTPVSKLPLSSRIIDEGADTVSFRARPPLAPSPAPSGPTTISSRKPKK